MCRKRDAEKGCGMNMGLTVAVLCAVLCVYQPWVALAAPLNAAVSRGDGNDYINANQSISSSTADQSNAVDVIGAVNVTPASTSPKSESTPAIHLTTANAKYELNSKQYSTDTKYSSGAVFSAIKSQTTTTTEFESILSKTTTATAWTVVPTTSSTAARIVSTVPERTSSTSKKTTAATGNSGQARVTTTSTTSTVVAESTASPSTTQGDLSTNSFKARLDSGVTSPPPTKALTTTAVTTTFVSPQLSTVLDQATGITTPRPSSIVTTETLAALDTSQIGTDSSTVTLRPVIAKTNTTVRAKTTDQSNNTGSTKTTTDHVVDAATFEVIDPQNYTSPPKIVVNATSSTKVTAAAAAIETPASTDSGLLTSVDSSSGDDISTFMGVSTEKDNALANSTLLQTAASNTTALYTSIKRNLTAVTNSSIYITSTVEDESATRSTASTDTAVFSNTASSSAASSTTPETINKTNTVINTKTRTPPIDTGPPGKGAEGDQRPVDQGSLTTILLVLCASLLALLLALCVFTYVKFRKKSRSIRKRLTFKDDSIYDNPIYHGRWEVPKAPEPTSSSCPRSLPMLISALPDEVVRLSKDEDTGFRLQFMMLDKLSPNSPRQVATTDRNTHKNRYRDILPFDHNRVKLAEEGDQSDYINASFVPGVKSEREYVASQGPLERTAADHWRMIWELNIRMIAMLTTCEEGDLIFKAKCCQYWPNKENESVNYGGIYVTLVSTTRLCRDNYKLKVLHIRKGKDSEPRKVQLFQYIKWPDRKNPEDPEAFLEFRDHVRREMDTFDEQSPLLVHCSAGVGRTGTFIAIDTLLQHMEERESIDVYGLVLRLRKYRVLLVQNANQYKFVHTCLLIKLDKMKKAEVDEGQKKAGIDGSYPYENMVMGQRAVVGELGGLVHGGDNSSAPAQQSSAVQSFLRKTKTNVQPDMGIDDPQCRNSDGMPSPVKIEEWPRPLSDPVPRPVIETPKSKPFAGSTLGDPERALAKELGGMFQGGVERHASPGKTAAIKAFLRNRDLEGESASPNSENSPNGDSLVIDNRFREETEKQTTCL